MAYDLGAGIGGGLSGLSTGASLGSFGGPIGTAIGAGVGGLAGLLSGIRRSPQRQGMQGGSGLPQGLQQVESYAPEQKQAILQMLQQALGQMQNPTQGFQPIAQEAQRRFQQETIPGIAERFTSMGAGGQRSSAFAGELGGAGADLSSMLAGQEAQFGQRQQALAQNLAQLGLQSPFQYVNSPQQPSQFAQFAAPLAAAGAQGLGSYFGAGGSIQDIMNSLRGLGGGGGGIPQAPGFQRTQFANFSPIGR